MKKLDLHQFKGMVRDVGIELQKPEFLYDAHNIRLTAREGDTLLSLTNERGTKLIEIEDDFNIEGVYVGHCVIGKYLTIFTQDLNTTKDYIYRILKMEDGSFTGKSLTPTGLTLNLDYKHPLLTLGVYENASILKVYWTDGINQPRVINITKDIQTGNDDIESTYLDTSFDFVRELSLEDSIHVRKRADSSGLFGAGVIQYAITYFDKYGLETNISCISPLLATSFTARAGSPEERIGNSFEITIDNPDTTFEYVRIYSIFRSSKDATPHCKKVVDIHLESGKNPTFLAINSSSSKNVNISYWGNLWIYEDYLNDPDTKLSLNSKKYADSYTILTGSSTYAFKFKKSEFPNLVIYDSNKDLYVTWGSATELWIQKSSSVHTDNKYYIEGNAELLTGSSMKWSGAKSSKIVYTDNNSDGADIEPLTLLYIGGEEVTAETITSKDGTLFLGNIEVKRPYLQDYTDFINENTTISSSSRTLYSENVFKGNLSSGSTDSSFDYTWGSTLNGLDENNYSTNGSCFKYNEHYRLGVLFQYKTGKWSDPIPLKNDGSYTYTLDTKPDITYTSSLSKYKLPIFKGVISNADKLINLGYRKVRGVVCFPNALDRLITAQGVLNPTVYNVAWRELNTPYCLSSWFFRPFPSTSDTYKSFGNDNYVYEGANILTEHNKTLYGWGDRGAEIQGIWPVCHNKKVDELLPVTFKWIEETDPENIITIKSKDELTNVFAVDLLYVTMHSPDLEFDTGMPSIDFSLLKQRLVGFTEFASNTGDLDIQLDTAVIGTLSTGFKKQTLHTTDYKRAARRLCAGLFFRDWWVDDWEDKNSDGYHIMHYYTEQKYEIPYMVYPWLKTGSLNNDIARGTGAGTRTAQLKEKIISNIKFSYKNVYGLDNNISAKNKELFNQDFVLLLKLGKNSYYGNVDTIVVPPVSYSTLFSYGENIYFIEKMKTGTVPFDISSKWLWGFCKDTSASYEDAKSSEFTILFKGDEYTNGYMTHGKEANIGDQSGCIGLRQAKDAIRMKYKSTPHLVMKLDTALLRSTQDPLSYLYMAEIYKDVADTDFGGTSDEALEQNKWYTAGEAITLNSTGDTTFYYNYGDTWFQRYDCLKTYPYTDDDTNQIVEIGSFMCETHVNIDGRYDKNRGMDSNLYVRPTNFNLINPVYSLLDNFFTYRILDLDYYRLTKFNASISWTKQKSNAADVDSWTNITLASMLDLDGCYGEISSLNCSNDTLYCFQSDAISSILFNSRVLINPTDGVPIEISNNYKVDGYKYISLTAGTKNKRAIVNGYDGLYFVDRLGNTIYLLQGNKMTNISDANGFGFWMGEQDTNSSWVPALVNNNTAYNQEGLALYYDNQYNDIYLVTDETALCYSEQMQAFISFFNYENVPAMFNLDLDFYSLYFASKAITLTDKVITVVYKTEEGDTINTNTVTLKVGNSYILTTTTYYKGATYLLIANKSTLSYNEVEDGKTYTYYFKKKTSGSTETGGTKTITITYYNVDTKEDLLTTSYSCTEELGKFLLPDTITVNEVTYDVYQKGYIYYDDMTDGDTVKLKCTKVINTLNYIIYWQLNGTTLFTSSLTLKEGESQAYYAGQAVTIEGYTDYKIESTVTVNYSLTEQVIIPIYTDTIVSNTVTFDFTKPLSLDPSVTPLDTNNSGKSIAEKTFTAANSKYSVTLNFNYSGNNNRAAATLWTKLSSSNSSYYITVYLYNLTFSGVSDSKIKSIKFNGNTSITGESNLSSLNPIDADKFSSEDNITWTSLNSEGENSINFVANEKVYINSIEVTFVEETTSSTALMAYSTTLTNQTLTLWKMFAGDYNKFYGTLHLSDFTFISNLEPTLDKIFTNLEIRADFYTLTPVGDAFNKEKLDHKQFFDTLQVWNEYQDTGELPLKYEVTIPSILKKKFRVWRAIIPRDSQYTRDRIRNTWTKVKLTMNKTNNYGMELHDIGVIYYN